MKVKYTIMTFNFGDYDCIREPLAIDPNATYLVVTDKAHRLDSAWTFINDKDLEGHDPIYSSFYVRFHPFKYTQNDIVIVIDGSIQLKKDLYCIVTEFEKSESSISLMLGNFLSDKEKISAWVRANRIDRMTANKLKAFMAKYDYDGLSSLGNAFRMFKRSKIAEKYNKHCWRCALALGDGNDPVRLDDVISSTLIATSYKSEDVFLVDTHILRSYYMDYYRHKNTKQLGCLVFYSKLNFRGRPANIHYFDPYCYPTEYAYTTEAILLTKYSNPQDLEEWLDWHLNKVKFDHVHIFNNESSFDVISVASKYGNRVTVELVAGHPRQYKLYDEYIERRSEAEWVMPIDDDEFLDIGDFASVADAVEYYHTKLDTSMIAVRWKHLFPDKFHTERQGEVLEYCTVSDHRMACNFSRLGDRGVKTIVRRFGKIHYQETWENPAGGHVPQHGMCRYAKTTDGRPVRGCGALDYRAALDDERIRLLHCRYKGYSDWMNKYGNADNEKNCRTVCDSSVRDKKFKFNELLPSLD